MALASKLVRAIATPFRRRSLLRRAAPVWLGLIVTAGSMIPPAPAGHSIPQLPVITIPTAFAGYPCSSHAGEWPTFTGHLSNSSGTMLAESTSGAVYGRISNVDRIWQPTPGCGYYRYDGIVWATTNDTTHLTVDWGAMSGDGLGCTFLLNTSDLINSDSGSCGAPSPKLVATLTPEATYHNDTALSGQGDFVFAHADCITWYGVEPIKINATTSVTSGEPGANCGNKSTDSTGTTQTLVVDGTAPTISFTFPAAGGPVLVPSAFAGVTFTATDAVALFGGADDWDLQRQIATWSGSACGAFGNDTGTEALVSGTNIAVNQVSSQGLQLPKCYRWTLAARDQNGNTASTITSGSIRTDTSAVWGDQPQFGMASWDLGAGDSLAVSTGSGNLRATHPIVSQPIVGGTLGLSASYNSHDTANVGIGPGWRLNVQQRLTVNGDGSVTFTDSDGSRHTFTNATGSPTVTYTRPATLYATLTRDTAATPDRFTLTYRDQSVDVFDEDIAGTGLLKQIKDRNGNTTSIAYSAGTAKISTITDPSSRLITFTWTGSNLTSIIDWANVSSGIVQASGSGNRTHRFFYDGSNNLIGWADPLNTAGSCPTGGSHLTCLTNTGGSLTAVAKTQTYETFLSGTLGSATRTVITNVAYEFADVIGVTDAEAAATSFTHPAAGETKVTRPGTPASETTYGLVSATDANGRIDSVKRKLGAAQIETETTYSGTYPIEPATLKENKGGGALEQVINYTYQASSLGLLSRLDEPLDGNYRRYTDFMYNTNKDVTKRDVSSTDAATDHIETRYCYTTSGCSTSATDLLLRSMIENYVDGTAGGSNGQVEDVTTAYIYDGAGQRIRQTRSNYSGSTLLDSAAIGWTYDANGNVASEIHNYSNGTVTNPGDDITPNGTSNARTDLTTAFTYDTAGNRVSSADSRRAIETALGTSLAADDYLARRVYDALNEAVITRLSTTPGISDCGSPPGCREATNAFDEFGQVREAADVNDLVTATKYDKAGRALETYDDPAAGAAVTTSVSTYDAAGSVLTARDQRQAASAALGYSDYDYDELGRVTDITEAAVSTPDVSSVTHSTYDTLDRKVSEEIGYGTGTGQITAWTYDIGGRTTKVDDEFTCATTTYDYRDLPLTVIEGQATGSCSGSGLRTVTNNYDLRGRVTNSEITAGQGDTDILSAPTYDAASNQLSNSATTTGSTTSSAFTYNPLDQQVAEIRSDAGSAVSWTRTNLDPAGNPTDRCVWNTNPGSELCKTAGSSYTTTPATSSTTAYDARNERVSLKIPSIGETTYDSNANYQVAAIYVPTASGKEHQTLFSYVDPLHRLTAITEQLCTISSGHSCSATSATGSDVYAYDDNDNRTRVNENNGNSSIDQYYCYDALNRMTSRGSTTCTTGTPEAYTYDDAGNRTAAGSTTFSYDAQGQLSSCSPTCGTIAYDSAGRTSQWNGWYLTYDGDGRLATACKVSGCATGDLVTMRYDAQGHRVELGTRPSGGSATTTTFRYQGDAIAQELVGGSVTRTYITDEAGAIVKFCDPDCGGSNPQYLVTWNGHGDAASIWKIDISTGALTLGNSFTYTTWGAPTTTTHNSIADLGFRFLYVGRYAVAWDNAFGLDLEFMSARHYSPVLGRFMQPDPSALEPNLYAYALGNPVRMVDPSGRYSLNPYEWSLCRYYPLQCITYALASEFAGRLASAKSSNYQVRNSLRHCTWSCILRARLGYNRARTWTNAHELGDPENAYPYKDMRIDLHNNYVGRLLGEYVIWANFSMEIQSVRALNLCVEAWNAGYLWTNVSGRIVWSNGKVVQYPNYQWQ